MNAGVRVILAVLLIGSGLACGGSDPSREGPDRAELRHQALADSMARRSAPVLFLGDSIVELWEREGREDWVRVLAPHGAMNLGLSGDLTADLISRVQRWPDLRGAPVLAIIHIGTNDTNDSSVTAEDLAARVLEAARTVDRRWSPDSVLISALFPRDRESGTRRELLADANLLIADGAAAEDFDFLDIGLGFVQGDGHIPESVMPDALHLSAAGYRMWAEALGSYLPPVSDQIPSGSHY